MPKFCPKNYPQDIKNPGPVTKQPAIDSLIPTRLLAKNVLWNLTGQTIPLIVALVSIPVLIRHLGTERFGILSLVWMVIGYFVLFDIGLGRALTKLVAERIATPEAEDVARLTWTALFLMAVLGLMGAMLLILAAPLLVENILKIPLELQYETTRAFQVLALSVPVIISTAGLSGVLQAHQRFDLVNMVRIPAGVYKFLGPLFVLPFSSSLVLVVTVLVVGRFIVWSVYLCLCLKIVPQLRQFSLNRQLALQMLGFGGWMTVTNVIGPLMVYVDRFLIGAVVSMSAVAYYTTPYELVTKLWVLSGSLITVLFPAFSTSLAQDPKRVASLFDNSMKFLLILLFPISLILLTMASEVLTLWLGHDFAEQSCFVLQWLAAGVFINCFAQIATAFLQGAGRPDLTAKLYLLEVPIYLPALWYLLAAAGIRGAAIAWTGRVVLDTILLYALTHRMMAKYFQPIGRNLTLIAVLMPLLVLGGFLTSVKVKMVFLSGGLIAFAWLVWHRVLTAEDKSLLVRYMPFVSTAKSR